MAERLQGATKRCISLLEEGLGLQVSRGRRPWRCGGKTVVVASTRRLSARMRPGFKAIGVACCPAVRHLGVDYAPGRRVVRKVCKARWRDVFARRARVRRLGKTGGGHVARTGAFPALRCGVSVHGANDSMLKSAQRLVCSVRGPMGGRSAFARLALSRYDPGQVLSAAPILEWAKVVWEGSVAHVILEAA